MPNLSILSPYEAVFLASLPYRKTLFACGGWQASKGPAALSEQSFISFLSQFYLPEELTKARQRAKDHPLPTQLKIGSYCESIQILCIWDQDYPFALANIYDPPPVLFFWGNASISNWLKDYSHYIAIVGTRSASPICKPACSLFIKQRQQEWEFNLGKENTRPCIVSGLAYGVDRMAHLSAFEHGFASIAVLGSGIPHAGPHNNLDIIERAFGQDLPFTLLSEFPPYLQARSYFFPQRNRIIAGLVESVAIIQAPKRSGAMITARYALNEGRDVFAFDHSAFDAQPGSNDGCRSLLESGALVISIPELEKKITKRPRQSWQNNAKQLSFWRSQIQGMQWLGGNYYLKKDDTKTE